MYIIIHDDIEVNPKHLKLLYFSIFSTMSINAENRHVFVSAIKRNSRKRLETVNSNKSHLFETGYFLICPNNVTPSVVLLRSKDIEKEVFSYE